MQVGLGDYLEIAALQTAPATSTTIAGVSRVCGSFLTATAAATAHSTVCSFSTPFKVGVHFDADETVFHPLMVARQSNSENQFDATSKGAGLGYSGFHLNYHLGARPTNSSSPIPGAGPQYGSLNSFDVI